MNKKMFLLVLLFTAVSLVGLVYASGIGDYQLSQKVYSVSTSNGQQDFFAGMYIGGNPTNYITLSALATLPTTKGPITFPAGTKIDCDQDIPPGQLDPCDPF